MNNTSSSKPPIPDEQICGSTIVAIVAIVLVATWVAFAHYRGTNTEDANGMDILLLHPMIAILLIVLLARLRALIGVPSVVDTLIALIGIWLFRDLFSVLMPFILGFGLAYLFRLLLNTMQDISLPKGRRLRLSRGYARGILTVLAFGAFVLLFFYVVPQVAQQSKQMGKGLKRFYYQSVVPYVVDDKLHAFAIQPDNPAAIYLGTAHGIYRHKLGEDPLMLRTHAEDKSKSVISKLPSPLRLSFLHEPKDQIQDLTSEDLIGQPIQSVAAGKHRLYAGTARGLYTRAIPGSAQKDTEIWEPIAVETFGGKSVQAIAIPTYDDSPIYVGTDVGLYRSDDEGKKWEILQVGTTSPTALSVQSIAFAPGVTGELYIASDQGVYVSSNTGETWSLISSDGPEGQPIRALTVVAVNGKVQLYAGTSVGLSETPVGLYRWAQRRGWIRAVEEMPVESVSLLVPFSHQILYAGSSDVLYHRTDLDAEWKVIQVDKGILSRLEANPPLKGGVKQMYEYLTTKLPTLAQIGSNFIGQLFKGVTSVTIGFGGFLATALFVFMIFIYASQAFMDYIWNFINLFPQDKREEVKRYLTEIDKNLQSYLGGQITIILIIAIISAIVYGVIGVPFALLVGLFAGVCNAIPTVGPFIGGAFAVLSLLIGFAAGNFEAAGFLIRLAALFGAIFGIQAVDNSLITPRIMSSAVDIDPVLLMFGVIVGASILGFWGVVLATPIIVVIKSILTVSKQIRTTGA